MTGLRPRALLARASAVAPLPAWGLLAGVYLVAMLLNSARWHFGPDTRFYLAWAYHFGGLSEMDAGRRSYEFLNGFDWFAPFCWGACDTSDPTISYDWLYRGEEGGLFRQRLIYPLLSAPFVRLFGPMGMLVVPAIAYTAYLIMVVVLANRLIGRRWAVPAAIAAILPITIARFGLYAYTETLATALLLGCVLLLPLRPEDAESRPRDQSVQVMPMRRRLILFGVLLTLFAFTRQFHHVLVLGVVVAWLGVAIRDRQLRNAWAPYAAVSVGAAVVIGVIQMVMSPGYSLLKPFLEIIGADSVSDIPGALPGVVKVIVSGEVQVAGQDFGLVLIAVLGAAGIIMARRTPFAWLTVGILVGTFGLQLITALPSQNRYWALSVPLLAIHATALVARVVTRDDRSPEPSDPEPLAGAPDPIKA
jgi:hypothetical protein